MVKIHCAFYCTNMCCSTSTQALFTNRFNPEELITLTLLNYAIPTNANEA